MKNVMTREPYAPALKLTKSKPEPEIERLFNNGVLKK
jgi:hypothetical protein